MRGRFSVVPGTRPCFFSGAAADELQLCIVKAGESSVFVSPSPSDCRTLVEFGILRFSLFPSSHVRFFNEEHFDRICLPQTFFSFRARSLFQPRELFQNHSQFLATHRPPTWPPHSTHTQPAKTLRRLSVSTSGRTFLVAPKSFHLAHFQFRFRLCSFFQHLFVFKPRFLSISFSSSFDTDLQ